MTDIIFSTDGEERFRIPSPFSHNHYVGTKCPETKLEVKKMTIRAEQIVNATLELTLRPKSGDRAKVIATALREVVNLSNDWVELDSWDVRNVVYVSDILEIADELEAL